MEQISWKTSLLVVSLILAVTFAPKPRPHVPDVRLTSTVVGAEEPCQHSERCVAVYVTPWCPICHEAQPIIKEIRAACERSGGKVGMKIVVGSGTIPELSKIAEQLGGNIYLDPQERFYNQLGGGRIPAWFVWDREGHILAHATGVFRGEPLPVLVRKMIDTRLKLKEYLPATDLPNSRIDS